MLKKTLLFYFRYQKKVLIPALLFFVIIGLFILPYWIISAQPFPRPTGQWQVGTSSLIWNEPNQIGKIANIWYPTDIKTGINSPYIDNIDRALSAYTDRKNPVYQFIFSKTYLERIKMPSFVKAALANTQTSFPVVLFSPGFGLVNFLNSFYALEFASHGFIVVSINHPGSSASTMLVNGSQVRLNPSIQELNNNFEQIAGEIMIRQANTISMVLDKIMNLNDSNDSFLYHQIDANRIFAAGHSLGGAASFIACGKDQRISKCINLDGAFYDAVGTNYTNKKLFLINADRTKSSANKNIDSKTAKIFANDLVEIEKLSTKASLKKRRSSGGSKESEKLIE